MSETMLCPQCQTEVDLQEIQCPHCGAALSASDVMDQFDDLDQTHVSGPEHSLSTLGDDEDEELRTVRVEGFSSSDLAGFASGEQVPGMEYEQFMVQEDRTVVGGSQPNQNAWTGPMGGANQHFGPASGDQFPQAGPFVGSGEFPQPGASPFGAGSPPPPPGGYVLVEGADSPSMTVRQEAPEVGGRGVELATYSGPVDIARGSGSSSPIKNIITVVIVIALVVGGGLIIRPYIPSTKKPEPPKIVKVLLSLATKPVGAEVWIDGQKTDKVTPTTIEARIGRRVYVQIRKDKFKTVDFQWQAKGNDSRSFELALKDPPKPRPSADVIKTQVKKVLAARRKRRKARQRKRRNVIPKGYVALYLSTDPSGAKVRVQGRLQRGSTPLRILMQKGLEAKISIQKYGYYDASFTWSANSTTRKKVPMYRHSWYNP